MIINKQYVKYTFGSKRKHIITLYTMTDREIQLFSQYYELRDTTTLL